MKYYTFYPENLQDYDFTSLIEHGRCFVTEDALLDFYNRGVSDSLKFKPSNIQDEFQIDLTDSAIAKRIHNSYLEKQAISLVWRASANKQLSKTKETQVLRNVDKKILEEAEIIQDLVKNDIAQNGYDETLDWEKEDIDDTMRFNAGYMVKYFLAAYMLNDEALMSAMSASKNDRLLSKNHLKASVTCPKEQQLMQDVCRHFAKNGGNLDFIKLKITNLMNEYLLEEKYLESATTIFHKYESEYNKSLREFNDKYANKEDDEYTRAFEKFYSDFDKKHNQILQYIESVRKYFNLEAYDEFKELKKEYEKMGLKLQLALTDIEDLHSPYDETIDDLMKNSDADIREAIADYDIPMLKNVLFCKRSLFSEKRRTLAIEQGTNLLIPNTPEQNTIENILSEIKTMEKESKAESE